METCFLTKKIMEDDYQFSDIDSVASAMPAGAKPPAKTERSSSKSYADELFSKQIKAKFRTFYIDLKESSNGKFLKVSEKSHGKKTTIMMDAEDVPMFIEVLQEVKTYL